ncbi:hypothetical protein [Vibrio hyugaensis]|nr:hypothetical protein [Vibrio hyugaensis]
MKKRTLLAVTAALVGSVHSAPIAAQDKQRYSSVGRAFCQKFGLL